MTESTTWLLKQTALPPVCWKVQLIIAIPSASCTNKAPLR